MSDNTSTVKRPSHITPDTKMINKSKGTNKPMNIFEQFPNATGAKKNADGTTTVQIAQPQNRAQRRAMEKRNRKLQKKQQNRIMNYINRHPEAIKVELDEDKIAEIEDVFVTGMSVTDKNEEPIVNVSDYETTVGSRATMGIVDDACNLTSEEVESVLKETVE